MTSPELQEHKLGAALPRKKHVNAVVLMIDNPGRIRQLERHGITIVRRMPIEARLDPKNM